ncbi:arsenic transporter [Fictibacillus phosphorivorans]|uniref:Arsenic transporter n=1 Tax=Fictibacillus phosphorivorans TaxID=1221500 RepID=A0A165NQ16_9BACL|nr:arsenic transporter [Fictibacillus phosphorivorans]KZE67153.1 arsenic transporter [Fictibacillus phosphorivorans]
MTIHIIISVFVFLMTMLVIFWRPKGINEVWPATIGAAIILLSGIVTQENVFDIIHKIGGASITIISTIVMAVILESFGFFHWAASRLASLAKGSGYRLYWYIQLLCFLMTLLFNNDGSILITTPILILLLKNFRLKPHQQLPYLLTGALTATASSTPIGVSNLVNLIGLKIVNMTLFTQTAMMFVPTLLGLLFMSCLMFVLVKKNLPKKLPGLSFDIEQFFFTKKFHPLTGTISVETKRQRTKFMLKIIGFVFIIRCSIFVASFFSIPIEIVAVFGSLVLLVWRWYFLRTMPFDILRKTPWHILLFAFSMYVLIYGLHNSGLTETLLSICEPIIEKGLFESTLFMGGLISVLSNLFNNHPALLIGTIALTEMNLDPFTLKAMYLASIVGSDIGSLLLPIGTLASLIWMHILKQNKVKVKWKDYLKLSLITIPLTLIVTLLMLYVWIYLFFLPNG